MWTCQATIYSWGGDDSGVASVSGTGWATAVGPGSITMWGFLRAPGTTHKCPYQIKQPTSIPVAVKPTISGPNAVWWFNGQNPNSASYPTSVTLTTPSGSSATWSATSGGSRVSLSPSGNHVTVTSSGNHFSGTVGDISITVTVNGQTSGPFTMTAKTPWKLVPRASSPSTQCFTSPTSYVSTVSYDLHDNFDTLMSNDVGWNEVLGTFASESGSDWGNYAFSATGAATNPLEDLLSPPDQGVHPGMHPLSDMLRPELRHYPLPFDSAND